MADPVATANPLLAPWSGPLQSPPFDRIRADDFLPAFDRALAAHWNEIEAIAANPADADFANSVAAIERSGAQLARMRRIYWTLASAQAEPAIQAIESEISTRLTRHGSAINHHPRLFARVAAVWRQRAGLTAEQQRLTDKSYKGFLRNGAALPPEAKRRFAAIDERLAALSVAFSQNMLAAVAEWEMLLDEADLDGLPDSLRESAQRRAGHRGHPGRYLFTLDRSDVEPFLAFSARRDLRERMWRGFTGRCNGGSHDNRAILTEILSLRAESAGLLGYPTYADYQLDDSMAGTPSAAEALLLRVWDPARRQAIAEGQALQALAAAGGDHGPIAPWDWRYHSERVRREKFHVDSAAIRDRLKFDAVLAAAFDSAQRLYGLQFAERTDCRGYHPDVTAWEVRGADGATVGLLYTDYFARKEKQDGAWMGSLRVQEKMDEDVRPIVYLVANFAKAPDPADSRLSLEEARTLFHEFGHALHALLSDVTYPSLAGTAVPRDYVEFPSKFMEHWIVAPEVLRRFGIAGELIEALGRAEDFGQGFATVEYVAAAIIDLRLHRSAPPADPMQAEKQILDSIGMPPAIAPRYALPHFGHIFSSGYQSAYYSYLWSEVLDEDAFDAFAQRGDIFDRDLAERFRREILATGDSRDPMESFIAFRGRPPDETPLLRARSLLTAGSPD